MRSRLVFAAVAVCVLAVAACSDSNDTTGRTTSPTAAPQQTRPECTDRLRTEDPLTLEPAAATEAGGPRFVDVTCAAGLELDPLPISPADDCLIGPEILESRFPELGDAFAELDTKYGGFCQWERFSGGVAVGDVNGDGRPDLYVPRLAEAGRLFVNRGDGRFDDRTAAAGLDDLEPGGNGAAFADIDNDGDDDLAVSALGARQYFLFVNDGTGAFTEEAAARGVAADDGSVHLGFSIATGDYDRDGYVDLYFTEYAARTGDFPFPRARSRLLRNRGAAEPGHFDDTTAAAGVDSHDRDRGDPDGTWAFGATLRDLDGDAWPDLSVTRDFGTSVLFWNNGDGTFADGTTTAGATAEGNGMGATTLDLNGDGRPDRVVTSIFDERGSSLTKGGNWNGTGNRVFLNQGDRTFADVTGDYDLRDGQWGWGIAAIDARNRGEDELIQTSGIDTPELELLAPFRSAPTRVWERRGKKFVDLGTASGIAATNGRGLAVLDYDADGRLDIVIVQPGGSPVLYRNVSDAGHWLRVVALGAGANREDLHARVTVTITEGDESRTLEIQSVTDFLGQSERIAHFGLGDAERVARVEVELANGSVVVERDVAADQVLVIDQPAHGHDDDGPRRPLGRTADGRYLTEIDSGVGIAVSVDPDGTQPTAEQQRTADEFVAATYAVLAQYRDVAAARAAGYEPVDEYHYVNETYLGDDIVGDPNRIESLIYGDIEGETRLFGAMYLARGDAHGPQLAGPAMIWHYHVYEPTMCVASSGFPLTPASDDGECAAGEASTRSPEMLHVWLVHPEGRFGTEIVVPSKDQLDAAQRALW